MEAKVLAILNHMIECHPALEVCRGEVEKAYDALVKCYEGGGKLLLCGNGGSAADCEHIVGELMKGFLKKRPVPQKDREALLSLYPSHGEELAAHLQQGLPAIALTGHPALSTAYLNDVAGEMIFAQQVYGYGRAGDVLIGMSTSGNAKNVANAVMVAKAVGMATIGLTGRAGGRLLELCDLCVRVPEDETYRIQEYRCITPSAPCWRSGSLKAEEPPAFFSGKGRLLL